MKQHKIKNPTPATSTPTTATTRQEVEACLKELTRIVEKDPKKAAEVFKAWLDQSAKNSTKKRAA